MKRDIENRLPPGVAEKLGYYVYMYVHPRTGEPFYVGKGKGDRIFAHFDDTCDTEKSRLISELQSEGIPPRLEILAHRLKDEETAFRVEAAVIDALGLGSLTNKVSGWKSLEVGRMSLEDLVGFYAAESAVIQHPVLLIRINKLYRHGMSDLELYEATRGIWKLGKRREQVKYAFAVFHGLIREVYSVKIWHPAQTLTYQTRDFSDRDTTGRWEFEGTFAPKGIREMYLHKTVQKYLKRGNQSPTIYVGV